MEVYDLLMVKAFNCRKPKAAHFTFTIRLAGAFNNLDDSGVTIHLDCVAGVYDLRGYAGAGY